MTTQQQQLQEAQAHPPNLPQYCSGRLLLVQERRRLVGLFFFSLFGEGRGVR